MIGWTQQLLNRFAAPLRDRREDKLAYSLAVQCAALTRPRLSEAIGEMYGAELRGYIRARAFSVVRHKVADDSRVRGIDQTNLFERVLERTTQLVVRQPYVEQVETGSYRASLRIAG